jgi:hypothetical protein
MSNLKNFIKTPDKLLNAVYTTNVAEVQDYLDNLTVHLVHKNLRVIYAPEGIDNYKGQRYVSYGFRFNGVDNFILAIKDLTNALIEESNLTGRKLLVIRHKPDLMWSQDGTGDLKFFMRTVLVVDDIKEREVN